MSVSQAVQHFVISSLHVYRNSLSIIMLHSCRFIPTCSAYAEEAVRRYGTARGLAKTAKRLLRCHPGHPGGVDPA